MHSRVLQSLAILLGAFTLTACAVRAQPSAIGAIGAPPRAPASRPADVAKPGLVVLITVDQFGSDFYERYGANLTGGLKRLRDEGAVWMRGRQDHAIAETAPGHASTLSGRFPVSTGISSNSQGVNTADAPLIGSTDIGASPFRFKGTTLFDWMRAADPATRALSVSRKDRGAILPIGRAKTDVYWFASNGTFTTSSYYRGDLPPWVRAFNAKRLPERYTGRAWVPLLPADRYAERDDVFLEGAGRDYVFPHVMSEDSTVAGRAIQSFPWMDSLTLAFALDGVRALGLGADAARTDLLAISLSATDAIGHRYGPDSKEIHDHLLQLDRYLGAFLDALTELRGSSRVVVALTADHGVAPFPELRSSYYPNQDAQRVDVRPVWGLVFDAMRAAGVDTAAVEHDDGFRVLDPDAFRRAGVAPDSIAALWVRELRRLNGVARADLITELAHADTTRDHVARRWLHMLPLDGPVRAVVTLEPFGYWQGTNSATHGQPYDYDTNVPVLFWGAGIAAGRRGGEARVVDMGPTLAAWLGVTPLERLDGRPLPLRP